MPIQEQSVASLEMVKSDADGQGSLSGNFGQDLFAVKGRSRPRATVGRDPWRSEHRQRVFGVAAHNTEGCWGWGIVLR